MHAAHAARRDHGFQRGGVRGLPRGRPVCLPGGTPMSGWSCPLPLRDYPNVVLGHGGGGQLSAELLEHLFLPAFRNDTLAAMGDSAVLAAPSGRLAFTTDSYVVRPLFFPGGSIGELAVNGTVNDLAMA